MESVNLETPIGSFDKAQKLSIIGTTKATPSIWENTFLPNDFIEKSTNITASPPHFTHVMMWSLFKTDAKSALLTVGE